MMTKEALLKKLPPFRYESEIIHRHQTSSDLVREVLDAHRAFADHYDRIAMDFGRSVPAVCRSLFEFCKTIPYKEESANFQTTRSPAAILMAPVTLGTNDCKHYAGFIAGVLDALKRTGIKVDWGYRFCNYDRNESDEFNHVYVVVRHGGKEFWIDPTPIGGHQEREFNDRFVIPFLFTDKKVNMVSRLSGVGFIPRSGYDGMEYSTAEEPVFIVVDEEDVYQQPGGHVVVNTDIENYRADEILPDPNPNPTPDPVITTPSMWKMIGAFGLKNPALTAGLGIVILWAVKEALSPSPKRRR